MGPNDKPCHSDRSEAERNEVEEPRDETVDAPPRDPSTPLRSAQDDRAFDVGYAAKLARLALTAEETQLFETHLQQVLAYADKLGEVDVSAVDATTHTVPMFNVFREDAPRDWFTAEQALSNTPRQANGLFIVPKVVE